MLWSWDTGLFPIYPSCQVGNTRYHLVTCQRLSSANLVICATDLATEAPYGMKISGCKNCQWSRGLASNAEKLLSSWQIFHASVLRRTLNWIRNLDSFSSMICRTRTSPSRKSLFPSPADSNFLSYLDARMSHRSVSPSDIPAAKFASRVPPCGNPRPRQRNNGTE